MVLFSNLSFSANVILFLIVYHAFIIFVEKIKKLAASSSDKKSIVILVLGDVGRSPRMQRHAESLLNNLDNNYEIHFIGFIESGIQSSLRNNKRVKLHNIKSLRLHNLLGKNIFSFIVYAVLKVVSEILSLLWILIFSPFSDIQSPLTHIIMQNPPSVPIVIIAKYVSLLRGCVFIIDWHNFGFSILALKQKGIFVKLYRLVERYVGKTADIHLTVSKSMETYLITEWKFAAKDIYVLYDRATKVFLNKHINEKDDNLLCKDIVKYFENNNNGNIKDLKGDSLWMVSSTSWTPDEDLNMLLDDKVLQNIDNKISNRNIVLFITGKDEGNLKKEFVHKLNALSLKYVQVIPLWLESHNNYIHLLKWCDIGLCFHLSSSGLDLPMKVVDMFGVGIPVIAINFNQNKMEKIMQISKNNNIKTALHELVIHNKNGFVFNTSNELTKYILRVYNEKECLKQFTKNIGQFRKYKWDQQWRQTMNQTECFQFKP